MESELGKELKRLEFALDHNHTLDSILANNIIPIIKKAIPKIEELEKKFK